MKTKSETIRKFVNYLNNSAEQGGFWLPNIQRFFIWKENQIEKLYDSILREYPIGTLLIWKTNQQLKKRKFVDQFYSGLKISDTYDHTLDNNQKMLVLDGQQRLQSLYIGLNGTYNRKELFINILSGDVAAPDEMKYKFEFYEEEEAVYPWIKFKKLVFTDKLNSEIKEYVLSTSSETVSISDERKIEKNIEIIRNVFCTQENIIYQEVDSIDRPTIYTEDDVVEVFIRANSGGTTLGKSDLMFSLLISSWNDADLIVEDFLGDLNRTGFKFSRDFLLKTSLVLLNKGARYNVKKFREDDIKQEIIDKWDDISSAILDIKDYIYGKTYIKTDKTLPSYLNLIPIIYLRYHYPTEWSQARQVNDFLLRTLLVGAFSGNPDNIIDKLVDRINDIQKFDMNEFYDVIRANGRNLEINKETILSTQYGSNELHLLFNLWYNFNYEPAFENNEPQADHIFPQSLLRTVKDENPETGRRSLMRYRIEDRDQIANLMLLTRAENGAGGKTDISPEEWFADKDDSYLDMHLIPKDKDLWKLVNFESFVKERKKLILEKFDYLLIN